MLIHNCLVIFIEKNLFAIYLRHGSYYINVRFVYIIHNIGYTFYAKMLIYKLSTNITFTFTNMTTLTNLSY